MNDSSQLVASIQSEETHLLVLTGMSGGGKTVALRALEDLGFYCVDNLPTSLLQDLVRTVIRNDKSGQRRHIAVGVDVRNRSDDFQQVPAVMSTLAAAEVAVHLIFIDCRDDILIKRYSETRRKHPLSARGLSLADAIAEERRILRPLSGLAEKVIDSSDLNVHQLRRLIATGYAEATKGLTLMFESFAYRRGLPPDADFVFDARCLPNPHWDAKLRPYSGKDAPVREFLDQQALVGEYFQDTSHWLDRWLPRFEQDDRSYVTISIGCTGGRHRSVYLAEKLAAHYRTQRENVLIFHRELE
ncbi:RNase adapter RapZ [Dyella sp.]|uniref:RNase adapter RapZ n=1 Tax=Dyella sp. TaxID=1869338 RepID=UPI002ED572D9